MYQLRRTHDLPVLLELIRIPEVRMIMNQHYLFHSCSLAVDAFFDE